jgi:hypothetical protein
MHSDSHRSAAVRGAATGGFNNRYVIAASLSFLSFSFSSSFFNSFFNSFFLCLHWALWNTQSATWCSVLQYRASLQLEQTSKRLPGCAGCWQWPHRGGGGFVVLLEPAATFRCMIEREIEINQARRAGYLKTTKTLHSLISSNVWRLAKVASRQRKHLKMPGANDIWLCEL